MVGIESGISGLDGLFEEGIPQGSNILVFGKPGSGKTILGLEFLYKGAALYNEPGVLVTFEHSEKVVIAQCEKFGWDIKKYIKKGMIKILTPDIENMNREFANDVISAVNKIKAKRLIVDNLALLVLSPLFDAETKFSLVYKDKVKVASTPKHLVYNIINIFKDLETTTMYITVPGEDPNSTCDGISEYICDGVIHLDIRSLGKSFIRTIEASKMRRSNITGGIHGFKITSEGIKVE